MFLHLTVHFIDADFKLQSVCLKTLEIPQDHDAMSLRGVLCVMLQDWKISDKVFCGTTDNSQSIGSTIGLLGIEQFPCIAHTLQLAIMKALQVPRVHNTIARCKKLVEHFKKSSKETYKLCEKQVVLQIFQHQLMQECPTRWGSTQSMLKRLAEQQSAIAAVLMKGKVTQAY